MNEPMLYPFPPRRPFAKLRRGWPAALGKATGKALAVFLSTWLAAGCAARPAPRLPSIERRGSLDGIGYAKISDGDIAAARKQALKAALRDMALSARAVVRARSTQRILAEDGKPVSESLDDLIEVSAFQVLASRHILEDVDLKAGVYRVYLWLTADELRESIAETRIARKALFARAQNLFGAAEAEAETDPLEARKKLRKILDWVEGAGLQTDPDGVRFHARIESLRKKVEDRVRRGNRLYDSAGRALEEGRLRTAAARLAKAEKALPHPDRSQNLAEGIAEKRRRVSELKNEAATLRAEDKLEEALEVYREAETIDREDKEVRSSVADLRTAIAWQEKARNRKVAAGVRNFFLILGTVALVGIAAAAAASTGSYGHVRPVRIRHNRTGGWRR